MQNVIDTTEATSLEQVAQDILQYPEFTTKKESPAEQYPKGFKFQRLRRDGGLEELIIKRYLPDREVFIVGRAIGDFEKETEMSLSRIEAMTDPELAKNPVGTNVIIPIGKGRKAAGKVAGYLKEKDVYIVRVHENGKSPVLLQISRESFEAINYREVRRKVEELLK